MGKRVAVIVDSLEWIQAQRVKDLQAYLPEYILDVHTAGWIVNKWQFERHLSGDFDAWWLASWRILLANPELQDVLPWDRTLCSVTSHYNIGGGLNPPLCFRKGADPEEEFQKAIATLKQFRLVTCNSKILWDMLAPHLLPSLVLAQNGVDCEFYKPTLRKLEMRIRPDRLGWVLRHKGAKNLPALLAAKDATECMYWFVLTIAKDNKAPFGRDDMLEYYRSIDYLVCASWHEGTPNPALEAAACGLPIITTPVGNMPELVREGDTGWFIEPTAESLIDCVERLQHLQGWEYRRMSHAIRAEIEANWTWARRAEAYRKALEAVCG